MKGARDKMPLAREGGPAAEVGFAKSADLEALADLLTELFTLESDYIPDRERQLARMRLILETPALGRLFVLRVEEEGCWRVAGMANALITVSTARGGRVLLLEDVILHRAYRGRGLGRRLVEHVQAWAAAEGLGRITLLADRDNTAALAFYQRLGFMGSTMKVLRKPL